MQAWVFVAAGAAEVEEPVLEAVVLLLDAVRVTVPLMTLKVSIPAPPTSRVTVLVDPLDVVVIVDELPVPVALPVDDEEEAP